MKWGIGVFLVAAAVGGAFVGGVRVGASIPAAMSESFLLQSGVHQVNTQAQFRLLEAGEDQQLRELLDMKLDGDVLALCSTVGASEELAWTALARIARHRQQHPPVYPADWVADARKPESVEAKRRIDACLKTALERSQGVTPQRLRGVGGCAARGSSGQEWRGYRRDSSRRSAG